MKFGVERLGGPTEASSVGSGQKRQEPAGAAAPAAKKAAAKKAASK